MNKKYFNLSLPEGIRTALVTEYVQNDSKYLLDIYIKWRELSDLLNSLDSRGINLPDGLSEISFCLAKKAYRINDGILNANSSFDCYDFKERMGRNRIQVKACSVIPDLTSFGPDSEWDRIYFLDFYKEGSWDGSFDVYEIDTNQINNYKVNRNQTLADQKRQGKRPRFSIYSGLIQKGKYLSKETYLITRNGVVKI